MVSRAPWWANMSTVETEVECVDGMHRLQWVDGALRALDHDDAEAEDALAALGGQRPACLALTSAWRDRSEDPELVTLGRRPGEATLGIGADGASWRPAAVGVGERRNDFLALLSLPAAFLDRLVLESMAAAASRWSDPEVRRRHGLRLGAALVARAQPALHRLAGRLPDVAAGPPSCEPAAGGSSAEIVATRTRGAEGPFVVTASLPLEWLCRVWGPGLSEPDEQFVIDVVGPTELGVAVDVAVWVPAGEGRWQVVAQPAELRRDGDGDEEAGGQWRCHPTVP